MTQSNWQTDFVSALQTLAQNSDRGTLAKLRRGLGKDFGCASERDAWVLRHVPVFLSDFEVDNVCLVASLFASHSQPHGKETFGAAFRRLADDGGADSIERRFHVLLESDAEDLPDRLRHAVSLLKSKDIPIDWLQLLNDVCWWGGERRSVQRRWSRDFWASDTPPAEEPASVIPKDSNTSSVVPD